MTLCPYCSSQGSEVRLFQTRGAEQLQLWRCGACSSEFLDPQPSDAWLANEYAGYFKMRQGRVPATKARLCQMLIGKIGELPPHSEVLEIGGGEGYFLKELLASRPDVKITLVEPQADASHFPADRVEVCKMLVEEWLETAPVKQYDAVIAMDLIEHLRDPMAVVKHIAATRLKPGGALLITTPDAGSIFRRLLGRYWPHYKVEHLTYPSTGALTRLAQDSKLKIVEIAALAKPLQLGYLIAVLRNFGPVVTRIFGRLADTVCPGFLRPLHVRIPSGELLFIGRKVDTI